MSTIGLYFFMNITVLGLFLYGFLLLLGGIIGYVKASSLASLVMGVTFSFLICFAAFLILSNHEWGEFFAKTVVTLLFLFFAYRFFLSFKMMPGGVMAFLSLIMLALLFKKNLI
jgi:uncharacterized membrane protein (UPF0136 family)